MNDNNINVKQYKAIEHGEISKVKSIVLHRTAGSSAISALNGYASGQKVGAHFLIANDGKIYQTASLEQLCWHVGILYARCMIEKSCDPKELTTVTALLHQKGFSFSKRVKNVSRHELGKTYPLRYPSNNDSIGIEVVGRYNQSTNTFERPTNKQFKSLKFLVDLLVKEFSLNLKNDVYAHGVIARKKKAEGIQLLQYLVIEATP
ncbi:MAG: N-acetylmuramoyl-L-alanine amidase [Thiotrichales bacterium]|nr:MAG: N-acetylmuramoyl-L-alanine amidase [Thiotrichales bacterium]